MTCAVQYFMRHAWTYMCLSYLVLAFYLLLGVFSSNSELKYVFENGKFDGFRANLFIFQSKSHFAKLRLGGGVRVSVVYIFIGVFFTCTCVCMIHSSSCIVLFYSCKLPVYLQITIYLLPMYAVHVDTCTCRVYYILLFMNAKKVQKQACCTGKCNVNFVLRQLQTYFAFDLFFYIRGIGACIFFTCSCTQVDTQV